jgi:hypothetical protein
MVLAINMVNPFLTNSSLVSFIDFLNIDEDKKNYFMDRIPQMDEEEREELLSVLRDVYLLEKEKEEAISMIREFYKKRSE